MLTRLDGSTTFPMFALATFVLAVGVAPVLTLTTDLVIGSAPPERAGAASAISETSAESGGALGIAVFGSIGMAVYRSLAADAIPHDIGPDAGVRVTATLGGAVELAGHLAAAAGRALTIAAREAFVTGLRICAAISAAASAGLAVFVLAALRHVRPSGAGRGDAPASATSRPEWDSCCRRLRARSRRTRMSRMRGRLRLLHASANNGCLRSPSGGAPARAALPEDGDRCAS